MNRQEAEHETIQGHIQRANTGQPLAGIGPAGTRIDRDAPTTSSSQNTRPPTGEGGTTGGAEGGTTGGAAGGAQTTYTEPSTQEQHSDDGTRMLTDSELATFRRILYDRLTEFGLSHERALEYVTGVTAEMILGGLSIPETLQQARQMITDSLAARKRELQARIAATRARLEDNRQETARRESVQWEVERLEADRQETVRRLYEIYRRELTRSEPNQQRTTTEVREEARDNSIPRRRTTEHRNTAMESLMSNNTSKHTQPRTESHITHTRTEDTSNFNPRHVRNRLYERQRRDAAAQLVRERQETMEREARERERTQENPLARIRDLLGERDEMTRALAAADRQNERLHRQNQQLREAHRMATITADEQIQQMNRTIQGLQTDVQRFKMTTSTAQSRAAREAERAELEELKTATANQRVQDVATQRTLSRRIVQLEQHISAMQREHEMTSDRLHNAQGRLNRTTMHERLDVCPCVRCREHAVRDNITPPVNTPPEHQATIPTRQEQGQIAEASEAAWTPGGRRFDTEESDKESNRDK